MNMPDKVVRRSKTSEVLALVACIVAFSTSFAAYVANAHNIDKIQESRREFTLMACKEQNQRNINTKTKLRGLADKAEAKNPDLKSVVETNIRNTDLLIDALVPKQNCADLVQRRYG